MKKLERMLEREFERKKEHMRELKKERERDLKYEISIATEVENGGPVGVCYYSLLLVYYHLKISFLKT